MSGLSRTLRIVYSAALAVAGPLLLAGLVLGAEKLLAVVWQLPDAFATGLMQSFYSQLISKESPPHVALSRSMRQMISNGSKDPGIWGAYALTVGVFPAMN